MQKSNAPVTITVPFANGASTSYRNNIPIPSQITITPGLASWTDGFPPLTMTSTGAGGIPPYGQDMNGLGFALSTDIQWLQLGYVASFSSSVSTALGGYPSGACVSRLDGLGYWLSTADNNTTNPDANGATNWIAMRANAGKSTIAVTGGTVTPDPSVLGAPLIILTGTLSSNLTLVLPLTQGGAAWAILNLTTGSFMTNVQGATGSGVTATQGSLTDVRTDGTNFYTGSLSGGPFLPLTGTAVAATKLATARNIAITGDMTWSVNFDGSANVTAAGTIANSAVTLAKMANFTANSLMGNPTGAAAAPSAITLGSMLAFGSGQLNLAAAAANTLLGNATGSANVPTAVTLANGLQFSGTALGLGAITPTSVTASGTITSSGIFAASSTTCIVSTTGAGSVYLRPNGSGSAAGQAIVDPSGNLGVNTIPTSVPGIGNPTIGTGNIIAYNAGPIALLMITDSTAGRVSYMGFGSAGVNSFDAGLVFNNSVRSLVFATGNATRMTLDISGNLSVTGTINAQTSDARVKTNFAVREPQPLHKLWWGDYDRTDVAAHGVGHKAQDVQATHPHRVHTSPDLFLPDGKTPMLLLDRVGLAEEQGIWCGRQIDQLLARVEALEHARETN